MFAGFSKLFSTKLKLKSKSDSQIYSILSPLFLSVPFLFDVSAELKFVLSFVMALLNLFLLSAYFYLPEKQFTLAFSSQAVLFFATLYAHYLSWVSSTPIWVPILTVTAMSFIMHNVSLKSNPYEALIFGFVVFDVLEMWVKLKFSFITSIGLSLALAMLIATIDSPEFNLQSASLALVASALTYYATYLKGTMPSVLGSAIVFIAVYYMINNFGLGQLRKYSYSLFVAFIVLSNMAAGVEFAKVQMPGIQPAWWDTLDWISHNTPKDAHFLNWWNMGHHMAYYAERPTLIDNTNRNIYYVKSAADIFASVDLNHSYELLKKFDVNYIAVSLMDLRQVPYFASLAGYDASMVPQLFIAVGQQNNAIFYSNGRIILVETPDGVGIYQNGQIVQPLPLNFIKHLTTPNGAITGLILADRELPFIYKAWLGEIPWLDNVYTSKDGFVKVFKINYSS